MPTETITNADRQSTTTFSHFFGAYMEASDEAREVVRDMTQIMEDLETEPDEFLAAADTLFEALFPVSHGGELGIDIEDMRDVHDIPEYKTAYDEIGREDAAFAKRLQAIMDDRDLSQAELAEMIGVQQPAISMMLSRCCHPQRRTVIKIAKALDLPPDELWPGLGETAD